VTALLSAPEDPAWETLEGSNLPRRGSLFLTIPEDPQVDTAQMLLMWLESAAQAESGISGLPVDPEAFAAGIARISGPLAQRSIGLVVLDDLGRRFRALDPPSAAREARTCASLIGTLSAAGILVVVVAGEAQAYSTLVTSLAPLCEIVTLTSDSIAEVIGGTLAPKDAAQSREIRSILQALRRRLPLFGSTSRRFVQLYPIHPSAFRLLFKLRRNLPSFSPLEFVRAAIESSLPQPATDILTTDALFDSVLPDFRDRPQSRPPLDAYDALLERVIARLRPSARAATASLLKAIGLHTLCGGAGITVRSLAHELLPDESDLLSSYALTSALLIQLEQKAPALLVSRGEKLDRCYRLSGAVPEATPSPPDATDAEYLVLQFPAMLFDWVHRHIPSWNPEPSPRYQRESQSLTVSLPEDPNAAEGIVYFKNTLDPLWSPDDIVALQATGAAWALLVLSPFEPLRTGDPELQELMSYWNRIAIWQPDTATPSEQESLRKAAPGYSVDFGRSRARRKARQEAHRIIRSLYVERGRFAIQSREISLSAEVSDGNIAAPLSRLLARLASTETLPRHTSVSAASAGSAIPTIPDATRTRRWVSLLCGSEGTGDPDLSTAELQLISWWETFLEADCRALMSRLHALPDGLLTTRIWDEIKFLESSFDMLSAAINRLRNHEVTLSDAIAHIAKGFGNDEGRLLRWRNSLHNLAGFVRWIPAYRHARDYILGAFPALSPELSSLWNALVDAMGQPHRFVAGGERDSFDARFLTFSQGYRDLYSSLHEEALGRIQTRVDPVALRNLELLTRLHYADRSYLDRVRLIGRWADQNRCELPVRRILERYPRCHCNFVPAVKQDVTYPVAQINKVVEAGTEHVRRILRHRSKEIIDSLESFDAGSLVARQIASILSHRPLVALSPQSIDMLNRILTQKPATEPTNPPDA
jgi:hypothetical protein